ncbi:hypothetical protein [Methylobacterium nodulans]|uniref:Uncharacterized protein n=1 Tax=Methylobacterium nodulans (strain LMG 21967 / CNCM I-2342 / ORS 2060) TaxID=460265 RepID=B8IRM7_METNO|nr:hypothetical protein [Methylobacterium nodulans]ACL60577.1 hypothetical protein Mnod_5748 [Methylobacterium nodulans ORS 2060]
MPWRTLIGGGGFRVMRPGFDVFNPSWDGILMDLFVRSGQILEHGIVTLGAHPTSAGAKQATVGIGPYSVTPDVVPIAVRPNGTVQWPPMALQPSGSAFNSVVPRHTMQLRIATNQFVISCFGGGGTYTELPDKIMYLVYRRQTFS